MAQHARSRLTDESAETASGVTGILEVTSCPDGTFLVVDRETGTYGHGHSPNQAFEDFVAALAEYRDLLAGEPRLTDRLTGHLAFIDALLSRPITPA